MGNLSALAIINFANDDFLLWDTLLLKLSLYTYKMVSVQLAQFVKTIVLIYLFYKKRTNMAPY